MHGRAADQPAPARRYAFTEAEAAIAAWPAPDGKTLRGEVRLAMLALWRLAGERPSNVELTTGELAAIFRASETAARTRWLPQLLASGLYEVVDQRGQWFRLYCYDPADVAAGRRLDPPAEDPQRTLFELESAPEPSPEPSTVPAKTLSIHAAAPDPSTDPANEPTAATAARYEAREAQRPVSRVDVTKAQAATDVESPPQAGPPIIGAPPSDAVEAAQLAALNRSIETKRAAQEAREQRRMPGRVGEALPSRPREISRTGARGREISDLNLKSEISLKEDFDFRSPEARADDRARAMERAERLRQNELVRELLDMVGRRADPAGGLDTSVARKIVVATSAGWLDWRDVMGAIDAARDKVAAGACPAVWVYFVGAMQKAFEEAKQSWYHPRAAGGDGQQTPTAPPTTPPRRIPR